MPNSHAMPDVTQPDVTALDVVDADEEGSGDRQGSQDPPPVKVHAKKGTKTATIPATVTHHTAATAASITKTRIASHATPIVPILQPAILTVPPPSPSLDELLATSPVKSYRKSVLNSPPLYGPNDIMQNDGFLTGESHPVSIKLSVPILPPHLIGTENDVDNNDDDGGGDGDADVNENFNVHGDNHGRDGDRTKRAEKGILSCDDDDEEHHSSSLKQPTCQSLPQHLKANNNDNDDDNDSSNNNSKTNDATNNINTNATIAKDSYGISQDVDQNISQTQEDQDGISPIARMRMDTPSYVRRHVSVNHSLGDAKTNVPRMRQPLQQQSLQQQKQRRKQQHHMLQNKKKQQRQPQIQQWQQHYRRDRSITLGSENSLEDTYGGYSLSKVLSHNSDAASKDTKTSLSSFGADGEITLSMLQLLDLDIREDLVVSNSLGYSFGDNDGPQSEMATKGPITTSSQSTPLDATLSKPLPLKHMESIASPPSVSSVSSLEEEELDRLASELSRPRMKSKRERIFRGNRRQCYSAEPSFASKSKWEGKDSTRDGTSLKRNRNGLSNSNDDIDVETGQVYHRTTSPHSQRSRSYNPFIDGDITTVNSLNPIQSKSYDTLGCYTIGGNTIDARYHRKGFRPRILGQAAWETSDSTQFTNFFSMFQYSDWDWSDILYLSIFSAVGVTVRTFMGRIFGGDCDSPGTPIDDWLYPLSHKICITATGRTEQHGGALFTDLPANMFGSLVMGVMTGMSPDWPAITWLSHDHPLQSEQGLHLGIKTALCGTLTTFSSWNSQMVLMMDGFANPHLGQQVGAAMFGYVIGLQASVMSFRAGRTMSAWFQFRKNPHIFEVTEHGSRSGSRSRRGRKRSRRRRRHDRGASSDNESTHRTPVPLIIFPSMEKQKLLLRRFFWNVRIVPAIIIAAVITLYILGDFYWKIPYYRQLWIACLVAPLGTICRWKLSVLNGKIDVYGLKWFPMGTFLANLIASIISVTMSAVSIHDPNHNASLWETSIFKAISLGFAGSLSTVSTLVKEIVDMTDKNPYFDKKAFVYSHGTMLFCCLVGLMIYSPIVWS